MLEQAKPMWFIIMPDTFFSGFWVYLMQTALLYTAFAVPVDVAFGNSNEVVEALDITINLLFVADLFFNFVQAFENEDKNIEFRLKQIAVKYVKSWFFIDFIACVPINLILEAQADNSTNKLLRLARLPRLYRLVRLVRLLKMGDSLKRVFQSMNINLGVAKLGGVLFTILIMIHFISCFWYWIAVFC